MQPIEPVIIERRTVGALVELTLGSPELAGAARPGQYVLVRAGPPQSADPLLRRTLFVANVDGGAGLVSLLIGSDERGMAWIATRPPGTRLDLIGPLGRPFQIDNRSQNLLLAGVGTALPALLFLAHTAVARNLAVVLIAADPEPDRLLPAHLLPTEIEYLSLIGATTALANALGAGSDNRLAALSDTPLAWADQFICGGPPTMIASVADTVRNNRLRWQTGFAQMLVSETFPCVTGACQACLIETKAGLRTMCKDGPVFDLRDLRGTT
jgi:dihydroorotate dehydrogenase electron transfer subunit